MQLNDLIEEYTIESIAKKTNVTEEVIARLHNKEFKTMKLPQAMGALSIIEREYDVDLDALRQECKAYYGDISLSATGLAGISPIKKERRVIPRLLVFVLLILLVYGAWYFFTGYYNQKILPLDTKSEKSFIDTILHGNDTASKDMKQDTLIESVSQDDVPEVTVRDDSATDGTDKPVVEQGIEANQSVPVAASKAVTGEESMDANQSTLSTISETVIEEQNDTALTAETSETPETNNSAGQVPAVSREMMTLLPQDVMWFRLIDLDTKKRRSFKRKDKFEIDLKEHNWLFATENAHFAIIDNDRFEEFSGEGKLFFRLDQEGIHQLSEDEYRAEEK